MNDKPDIIEEIEEPKSRSEISPPQSAGASATGAVIAAAEEIGGSIGRKRWVICALLFFAATINYVDRQVIGILKPTLAAEFGWTEIDYGWIVFAFQTAYAIGLLTVGRLMDKIGTKKGFAVSIVVWSFGGDGARLGCSDRSCRSCRDRARSHPIFGYEAAVGAMSVSVIGFVIARFALGIGEAGNFPASIKTVAEWFPKKERALATGIFNAGTNVGALATPLIVPLIVIYWGWYEAFIITGLLGFIWLLFWILIYKKPEDDPNLSKAELAYIQSDPPEPTDTNSVGAAFSASADVGFRHRQIFDRSDLVGLSFLAAGFSAEKSRFGFKNFRHSARRHLYHRRCRLDWRRLAFRRVNQTRLVNQCRT